jgi:PAS domain S-box-containing protein
MLDWAITQSPLNIALFDTQLRHVRLNAAMHQQLGLSTEAAGLGRRLTDMFDSPNAAAVEACARQALRTGLPVAWEGFARAPGDRERVWKVTVSPVCAPDGTTSGVLLVSVDVTEHHRARERLALVNRASRRIGSTLDVARTSAELAEIAVPGLADLTMIDLLDSVLGGDEPLAGPIASAVPLRSMACGSVLGGTPEVVARPGEAFCFPAHSSAAEALAAGRAVVQHPADDDVARWAAADPAGAGRVARHEFHSVMAVPIRSRGATLGVASFVRHQRSGPFEGDDLVLAEEIVARAAVCIDNARRYTREHATALALQHSLLQRHQPAQTAVQVATRYLPSQSGVDVGGDWFDVIPLSGSRVGLVVGDVVGHGIEAAATMGRLRTAVRTLADIDLEPEELLTRLDDVVTRLADENEYPLEASDLSATCLYAIYDPVSRRCSMARAGHPVPAIVTPDGSADFLDLPAGPPLGLGGLPFEEAEIELPEGSLLALYTDGLIESRERDIDTGLDAMLKVLSKMHLGQDERRDPPSLDAICDNLVEALLPERAEDDAALLIARTGALAPDRIVSWDLPAEPALVAEARARAARQVTEWGYEEIAFATELLVGELVTNAIVHAQPPIQLRMILDTTLSCEVSDTSSTSPHLRRADRYDEDGRGLLLVAQLAERWGTRHTRTGKTIWAQQPLPGQAASGAA